MNWDTFLDQTAQWLDARDLLGPRTRWVLGVSGGPDSTLLLHTLKTLSEKRGLGWDLIVAHLHHGMRAADADADAAFVESLAHENALPFHGERVDIAAAVQKEGGSPEELARIRRYDFLERVALKTGSDLVAVGHHADDDAETILHRICRGTGLRGLAGMRGVRAIQPGSRVRLVRPFLHQKRAAIEQICAERGIESRTDTTNLSCEFTRGRIRSKILPMLRDELNPNVTEALIRLAEQARWLGNYLEDAAARTFDSLVISEDRRRIVLNTHALLSKQRIIQAEVVRRAISLVLGGERDLSFSHIESVLKLADELPSGKELHLPGGIVARKVYERIEFHLKSDQDEPPELAPIFIECPGATSLPALNARLTSELCGVDESKITELRSNGLPNEEWLDYERLQLPLYVRGRREGDRFWPLGAPGSKSLGEFLSDEKIDPGLRARTGVVCDQAGPVWVMPLRIDERVKLRPTTRRALRLTLTSATAGAPGS